jgi:hypothetical protein
MKKRRGFGHKNNQITQRWTKRKENTEGCGVEELRNEICSPVTHKKKRKDKKGLWEKQLEDMKSCGRKEVDSGGFRKRSC